VGETFDFAWPEAHVAVAFSILERIDVGETPHRRRGVRASGTFSILERIDVGETYTDVSDNVALFRAFQYPRTDRRG